VKTAFFSIVATTTLAACALTPPLQTGQGEAEARLRFGEPTGRHALGGGGTRLEFATGPMGRDTWMVDLDVQGRVTTWHNALDEWRLHALQQRLAQPPVMTRDELLRTLGRPGERGSGGWLAGGELWTWRYPTNDCLLFQATLGADGSVRDAGFNIDPRCEAGDRQARLHRR
jgi:hypothetical protein